MLFAFEEVAIWGPEQGYDFDFPNQLDVGVDDNLYLSEFRGGRVFRISPEGDVLAQWGRPATLASPTGIAVDVDGSVYVAESASNRVRKFNAAGEVVATWGGQGTAEGLFGSAMGIDVSEDGRVYEQTSVGRACRYSPPTVNCFSRLASAGVGEVSSSRR